MMDAAPDSQAPGDLVLVITAADFAADRHRHQRRKDAEASPYINHPLALAAIQRLSSDIHPLYRALWIPGWFSDDPAAHDALKATATRRLLEFYAELDRRLGEGSWGPGELTGSLSFYTAVFLRWSAAVAPAGLGPHCEALRLHLSQHPALAEVVAREGVRLDSLKRLTD